MIDAKEMNLKTREAVENIEKPKRDASIAFCENMLAVRIAEAAAAGQSKIHIADYPDKATIEYIRDYMNQFGYKVCRWRNNSFFVSWGD